MWNLEDTLEDTKHGGRGFRKIHQGLNAVKLYTQPIQQRKADDKTKEYDTSSPESWDDMDRLNSELERKNRDELKEKMRQAITYCNIELPGDAVQQISPNEIRKVFTYIIEKKIKINITRLDVAFDTRKFKVNDVWVALKKDKFKTRASRDSITRHENLTGTNDGISIGSRESLQFLRIYTKLDSESVFGDKPFVRFELELHDERATHCLLNLLVQPLENWAGFCMSLSRGFIEFDAKWWRDLTGDLQKVWLRLEKKIPTIQSAQDWIYEQVAPSLAMILLAKQKKKISPDGEITYDLLSELLKIVKTGQRRLKEKHRNMIDKYTPQAEPSYAIFRFDADKSIADFLGIPESEYGEAIKDVKKYFRDNP